MEEHYPGSRNLIRQALVFRGVPRSSIDICLASISEANIRQYNSGLKYWWSYCKTNNKNIFAASVPSILNFLTLHYRRGSSYSTLNSYRSAIAQIINKDIANEYRIKRFFKGASNLRPSKPRYSTIWDPTIVLDYLKSLPDMLSQEELTYKLAALLALATGQRVQTLANIEICNIVYSNENIVIKIPKRIKTSGLNKIQPSLTLPFFNIDPRICVARCLQQYLDKTKVLRDAQCNHLFMTLKKPYKNARTNSISR